MTKKAWIWIAVLTVMLLVVGLFVLNTPASSIDPVEVNTPDHFEGSNTEVEFMLTSNVEPRVPPPVKRKHRIVDWKHRTKNVPLAAPGCKAILTTDTAINKYNHVLFSVQVKASWCWRDGKLRMADFNRDYNIGDEVWNLYQFREWKQPVRTIRAKYAYNRQGAFFEACLAWCFLDSDAWVSQTVRRGGSYDVDWKGR